MRGSGNSSKVQSPVSPRSPSMSIREEKIIETYFQLLSEFNFDQARELTERERDATKSNITSLWHMFVNALILLANDEKSYMSLSFLGPKWFSTRHKDSLRNSYQNLIMDFRKIYENVQQSEPPLNLDILLAHLCKHLEHFPMARLRTMDLYEQLTTIGNNRNFNYEDPVMVCSEIVNTFQKCFHHPLLSNLKTSFNYECEIIQHLLATQIQVSELDYLPALLQLHQAHTKLAQWGTCLPAKELAPVPSVGPVLAKNTVPAVDSAMTHTASRTKRSAFSVTSSRQNSYLTLFTWLLKYKNLLLSKFSIYFYEIINKNANSSLEMRNLCSKLPEDYYTRITNFEKKADIFVFLIVADTNGLNHCYTNNGYFHPSRSMPKPQGINSFPSIFKYPADRNVHKHWPNILMIINRKKPHDQGSQEKVIWFYDKNAHSTYFITLVEFRISVVVITDGKRSERDSPISNFLAEFTTQLRCNKHFASLKPG
ncbi:KICSTOR complex protein C12orf66 homolog isoform X1 [Argonauta hians]